MENFRRIEDDGTGVADPVGEQLKERIIGQDPAIDAIMGTLNKARLRDERRPVASFLFRGTTGVGKTETAETLADIMAVDKLHPALLRIDCAQYAQGHEVAALVGAPPGYVGREQKPAFDKELIEMPGSVILFDEIEKGHPKLWNYLLQIMEGGTVKLLNSGEEISFANSIVIMTSNVGGREMNDIMTAKKIGFIQDTEVDPRRVERAGDEALKRQFTPEFINRLDGIITFNSLNDDQLEQVLDTHIARSNPRYKRLGNVGLTLSNDLKKHLVSTAENRKEYGARPVLRNYDSVESKLGRLVSKNAIGGHMIHAELEEGEIQFYQGLPFNDGMATIEEILQLNPGAFEIEEPDCEDDEWMDYPEDLPEKVTPIRKRKK